MKEKYQAAMPQMQIITNAQCSTNTMEECEIVSNSFSMEHKQRLQHEIAIHSVLKALFKQLLTISQIATLLVQGQGLHVTERHFIAFCVYRLCNTLHESNRITDINQTENLVSLLDLQFVTLYGYQILFVYTMIETIETSQSRPLVGPTTLITVNQVITVVQLYTMSTKQVCFVYTFSCDALFHHLFFLRVMKGRAQLFQHEILELSYVSNLHKKQYNVVCNNQRGVLV